MIISLRGRHLYHFLSLHTFVIWSETYRLEKEKEWNLVSSCRVHPVREIEMSTCLLLTWIFLVKRFRLRRQQISTLPMWQHPSSNPRVRENMKDAKICVHRRKRTLRSQKAVTIEPAFRKRNDEIELGLCFSERARKRIGLNFAFTFLLIIIHRWKIWALFVICWLKLYFVKHMITY